MKKVIVAVTLPALVCAFALSSAPVASASILASDNFNSYFPGTLAGNTVGTWGTNAWLAPLPFGTSFATVNKYGATDMKVDVVLNTTANTVVAPRLLDVGIAQTFYVNYTINYTKVGAFSGNNTFGLVLSDLLVPSTTVAGNVINFGMRTVGTAGFSIRGGTAGTPAASQTTGGLVTVGTDYSLVARLNYTGGKFDSADMWLNPPAGAETLPNATVSLTAGTGITAVNSLFFRQASNQVDDSWRIDNLVLGTAWNDVVIPEPSTLALAALGSLALAFSVRRRK